MRCYVLLCFLSLCSLYLVAEGDLKDVEIFIAKKIITLDQYESETEAVAVSGEIILSTGSLQDLSEKFPSAKVSKEFENAFIVPGFIEHHIHPFLSAVTMNSEIIAIDDWDLPGQTSIGVRDRNGYLQRLISAEEKKPPDMPLISWGYHHYFHGKLSRYDLDKISLTRPIVVIHRSFHEFILNSVAMEILGIEESQFQIPDEDKPFANFDEGHFSERGAILVLGNLMSLLGTPEMLINGLRLTIDHLHSNGVTVIGNPGAMYNPGIQQAKNLVLGNLDNPIESYFMPNGLHLSENHDLEDILEATVSKTKWGKGKVSYLDNQIKLFADGAMYSQKMMMRDGYLDGHDGAWLIHEDIYKALFKIFWDAGYQIHVHQNGDLGLDRVLDVLEENLKNKPREDHRTTVVHFGYSAKDQIQRLKKLNVLVSANPYYVTTLSDLYSKEGVGFERSQEMVRLGDLERENIPFSLHSDMPMAPASPLLLMDAAINRVNFANKVAGPNQRVSKLAALKGVTINAAHVMQIEDQYGSIESGKFANFTVLEKNPLSEESHSIKNIKALATFSKGTHYPINN